MTISLPEVNIQKTNAQVTPTTEPQRVLFVGQKVAAGTSPAGQLVENIGNRGEEDSLFGANSMLAAMIRAAKKVNKDTRFDAIPLDDDGGAAKAGATISFAGTALSDGSITISVGSEKNHSYTVDVLTGEDADVFGPKFVAAITNDTKVQVTAAYNPTIDELGFLADNGGLEGNFISLKISIDVDGITQTLVGMSGGATNPSLTGLFDPIADERYQWIVWPTTYTLSVVRDFLDNRWNAANDILDGVAVTYQSDTLANLKTLADAENTQTLVMFGGQAISRDELKGDMIVEFPSVISSIFAALGSKRLTEGALISDIIVGSGDFLDRTGGPALASKPYFNTPMADLPLIDTRDLWLQSEIKDLNSSGVSVISNNRRDTGVLVGEVLTTYKFDAAGNRDITFKFLNYVQTLSTIAEIYFVRIKAEFPQTRLTDGDLIEGRSMVNTASFAAFLTSVYQDLAGNDFVLVEAGDDSVRFFKENIFIILDKANGKIASEIVPILVTQFRRADLVVRPTFDNS